MALAQRVLDQREPAGDAIGLEEQGAVPVAVAQEPLVRQTHLDAHPQHRDVETLRGVQVAHVHAEVIEPLDADHAAAPTALRQWALISASEATQTRGVWRTWSISSRRQASRDGRPMSWGWKVKFVTPCPVVIPSNSVSHPWSTGPGACMLRWPEKRKNGASSRTQDTGISTRDRPPMGACR